MVAQLIIQLSSIPEVSNVYKLTSAVWKSMNLKVNLNLQTMTLNKHKLTNFCFILTKSIACNIDSAKELVQLSHSAGWGIY